VKHMLIIFYILLFEKVKHNIVDSFWSENTNNSAEIFRHLMHSDEARNCLKVIIKMLNRKFYNILHRAR